MKNIIAALICLLYCNVWATTIVVLNTNDAGVGSLRNSVNIATSGDILDLSNLNGIITLTSGEINCSNKNLTFIGPGSDILSISGSGLSRIFYCENGDLTISDLTFIDGVYPENGLEFFGGGAIASYKSGNIELNHCKFINCSAKNIYGRGGAIDVLDLSPNDLTGVNTSKRVTINHCQFENCEAYIGGALVIRRNSEIGNLGNKVLISNTTFKNNSAIALGNNSSANDGGAIEFGIDEVIGGVDSAKIVNCTFYENACHGPFNQPVGAAISAVRYGNDVSYLELNSCTIYRNHGFTEGSGVIFANYNAKITNCIIADNTPLTGNSNESIMLFGSGSITSGGNNLINNFNGMAGVFSNPTDITTNFVLGLSPIANNGGFAETCAISCASSAIDNGGNCPAMDQRDIQRVCTPDIGAFENINCNSCSVTSTIYDTIICQGSCHELIAYNTQGGTLPYTFLWTDEQGDTIGTTSGPLEVCPTSNSQYYLQVIDGANAVFIDSMLISVFETPNITVNNDTTICIGDSTILNGSSSVGISQWIDLGTEDSYIISPTATDSYIFQVDNNGCIISDTVNIVVNNIEVSITGENTICQGQSIELTATIIGDSPEYSYNWDNGNSLVESYTITPQNTQQIVLEVTDQLSCSAYDTFTVNLDLLPMADFSALITLCSGENTIIENNSQNTTNYSWYVNGELISTIEDLSFTNSIPGCYDIMLIAETNNGCSDTTTQNCAIEVLPTPIAAISSSNTTPTIGDEFLLYNNSQNSDSCVWLVNQTLLLEGCDNSFLYAFNQSGNYELSQIVFSNGCSDTATIYFSIDNWIIYYIPNSFTPDGDEHNNTFLPILTEGFDPNNYNLFIYNRWGEILFESHDVSIGWDGTYAGKLCPEGLYNWEIKFKALNNDKSTSLHGHVNLLK